jgi:sulfur carrier protein
MKDVRIRVNGKEHRVTAGVTIETLLLELRIRPETVVVEYNRRVIANEEFALTAVENEAELEVVRFVGGG